MGIIHFVVKYVLFLFNLIFTIAGIATVVIGVLIHKKIQDISESLSDEVFNDEDIKAALQIISVIVIVLGCIVFVIAFSGCCGAVTETKCLLITYAVFMFVLIAPKIYLAVVWNKSINSFRHNVEDFVNDTFDNPAHNVTFHAIEASFNCCGTTGPESYEILPPTCCAIEGTVNIEKECLIEDAFGIGCLEYIDEFILKIAKTVKSVIVWVIVFEVMEFVGAVYLCNTINKIKAKPNYYH